MGSEVTEGPSLPPDDVTCLLGVLGAIAILMVLHFLDQAQVRVGGPVDSQPLYPPTPSQVPRCAGFH